MNLNQFKRKAISLLLLLAAALLQTAACAEFAATAPGDPSERMAMQRKLVAQLSGHGASEPGAGVRSSPAERAAAADLLVDALAAIDLVPQKHEYGLPNVNGLVDLLFPPFRGTNVYTVIEAASPNSAYVVIGAHYDSDPGSPGAGDNASGVALVHALGRELTRLKARQFNYLLVFFDQEEDDEVGSKAFAKFLAAREFDVHSVHVTDLAGWDDDDDGVVEVQSPGLLLEQHYRSAAERLGIPLRITAGGSSDNKSFLAAGYTTVGVFGDITRHLHKPTDTFETVDFQYLDRMTGLVLEVLADLPTDMLADAR